MNDITQRIDAVTMIGDTRVSMGGIQLPPKSVKVEITARCNLRCKYCALRTRRSQPTTDMSYFFMQKIMEDIRLSGVEEIGLFFLGESFCNPILLKDTVQWCSEGLNFPYIFLTSNATCAFPEHVEAVMANGLNSLKWSVNYSDVTQFWLLTGGHANQYEAALENIRKAYEIREKGGYKTKLYASSILYDGEQHDKMKKMLDKNIRPYVDRHYWLPLYQMSMYKNKLEKELGYIPTAGNCGRIDDKTLLPTRMPLPCWCTITEGHVRVDGGLSACGFGADSRFDMGMLDGTNFMRQWNSDKFIKLREAQFRTLVEGQSALNGTICEVCVAYEDKT